MGTHFRDWPIRNKLATITLGAILSALIIAIAAFVFYDRNSYREEQGKELQLLADITAQRSAAALSFLDVSVAQENLATLAAKKSIRESCFFSAEGKLFTGYPEPNNCPRIAPDNPRLVINKQHIEVLQPVDIDGRIVGRLWIDAELDELNARTWRFATTSLGIAALSALLAYAFAAYLTRQVIAPIAALSNAAKIVREEQDFSRRVVLINRDETGDLVDSFNEMLDTIQQDRQHLNNLIGELESLAEQNALHASSAERRRQITQQFFAGLSHDLRQPLQAIDLYSAVLKDGKSADTGETLLKLRQAVSNLDQLFRELLDAARFESQLDIVQAHAPVNISALLLRIHHEFEALALQKNIRLRLHAPETMVFSDVRMLERILRNLVSNAIRYTDKGGVLVGLRSRAQEVWLEVWDTGRGIPEEKLEVMFTPYSQVNPETDQVLGYGLGLAIVKRLSDALGHSVEVHSRVGYGTVFRLYLRYPPDDVPAAKTLAEPSSIPEDFPFAGYSVLVLDDEFEAGDALAALLNSWGMKTFFAQNTEDARQCFIQHVPQLIISDYHLSENELGTEFIQTLREDHNYFVALIVTAGDVLTLENIRRAGFDVLTKPIRPARLRALLQHLLTAKI